jgi:hypothetical protein
VIAGAAALRPDPLPWVILCRLRVKETGDRVDVQLPRHRFAAQSLAAAVAQALGRHFGYDHRPRDMNLRVYSASGVCRELVGVTLAVALARAQLHAEEFMRVEQLPFAGIDWMGAMRTGRLLERA